jgi:hypothetical protein
MWHKHGLHFRLPLPPPVLLFHNNSCLELLPDAILQYVQLHTTLRGKQKCIVGFHL